MTVLRVQKDKENPYVIINKKFLEDPNISLKLKGFLAYCLSKPDSWKFHIRQLATVLKEGKDALYSIINEGMENGYIERSPQRMEGKFQPVDYIIHESPIQKISTVSGKSDTDCSDTVNPTLVSNDSIVNKEERERERPQQASAAPAPNFYSDKFENRVVISPQSRERLIKKFGSSEIVDQYAEKLYRWSFNNEKEFKKKKKHDFTIEDWMEKDGIKPSQKPKISTQMIEERERDNRTWYREKFRQNYWNLIQVGIINEACHNYLEITNRKGETIKLKFNSESFQKDLSRLVGSI